MEMVEVFGKYALATVIMAMIVMISVGIVKIFTKVIVKNPTEKYTKIMSKVYLLLALVFSALAVLVYYLIFKYNLVSWNFAKDIAFVYSCTQAIYPLYEKYGGRTLFLKFISLFKGKNKDADDLISIIEGIVMLTDEQKEKLKEKL